MPAHKVTWSADNCLLEALEGSIEWWQHHLLARGVTVAVYDVCDLVASCGTRVMTREECMLSIPVARKGILLSSDHAIVFEYRGGSMLVCDNSHNTLQVPWFGAEFEIERLVVTRCQAS